MVNLPTGFSDMNRGKKHQESILLNKSTPNIMRGTTNSCVVQNRRASGHHEMRMNVHASNTSPANSLKQGSSQNKVVSNPNHKPNIKIRLTNNKLNNSYSIIQTSSSPPPPVASTSSSPPIGPTAQHSYQCLECDSQDFPSRRLLRVHYNQYHPGLSFPLLNNPNVHPESQSSAAAAADV